MIAKDRETAKPLYFLCSCATDTALPLRIRKRSLSILAVAQSGRLEELITATHLVCAKQLEIA
jgi:hypothetical protein